MCGMAARFLVCFGSLVHAGAPTNLLRLRGGGGLAFDAALFDFDGTLAQSEGLHRLAFSKVLGVDIDEFTCFHRTHKAEFLHQGSSGQNFRVVPRSDHEHPT